MMRTVSAPARCVALLLLWIFSPLPVIEGCGGQESPGPPARKVAAPDTGRFLEPTVLLISLDGFRWDYLEIHDAPNLEKLASEGTHAEALIPAFPTKTFPNHYTIVTGLYPEHHGIVSNTMFDPIFDASFSLGNREAIQDARWWYGEPIWVTAEKQGQRTATYFWPGSEAAIGGIRPSYWMPYDGRVPGERRVDQVLAWLDLPPAGRPTFLTLYLSEVDKRGHESGPESPQVAAAVKSVDDDIGRLLRGLDDRGIDERVNIIVTSDHGMAATSSDRVILLDDHIDLDDVRVIDWSPVLMMEPREGCEDDVFAALSRVEHLTIHRKDAMPERLHFRDHRRIPRLIALADEGWSIASRSNFRRNPSRLDGGAHGYDNGIRSMGGLFIAHGPAFGRHLEVPAIANIHLYEMMCAILGLAPASNDGDLSEVRSLLRSKR